MKYLFLSVILLSNIIINNLIAFGQNVNDQNCFSYIIMDANSGQVISQKNSDKQAEPASTTKVMTAIIALENGDLDRKLVASASAVKDIGKDGMNIGIAPSEELRLEDLLNALLVRSANETANIIAENLAPDKKEFMNYLNKRAKELGAKNTFFVNPCGKDSEPEDVNHLTTAYDLAKMAQYALTFPAFREIVTKKLCTIPPTNKFDKPRFLANTNKLLGDAYHSEYYAQINGIKTGFTEKAGSNLITSASDKNGNELIVVIMGYRDGVIFRFAKELLEYGFNDFTYTDIAQKNSFQKNIFLPDSPNQQIQLVSGNQLKIILPKDTQNKWSIEKKEYINPKILLPIKKGDNLGRLDYFVNNYPAGSIQLISNTTVSSINLSTKIQNKFNFAINFKYLVYIIFIVVFLILIFILIRKLFTKSPRKRFNLLKIKRRKRSKKNKNINSVNNNTTNIQTFKYFKQYNNKNFKDN